MPAVSSWCIACFEESQFLRAHRYPHLCPPIFKQSVISRFDLARFGVWQPWLSSMTMSLPSMYRSVGVMVPFCSSQNLADCWVEILLWWLCIHGSVGVIHVACKFPSLFPQVEVFDTPFIHFLDKLSRLIRQTGCSMILQLSWIGDQISNRKHLFSSHWYKHQSTKALSITQITIQFTSLMCVVQSAWFHFCRLPCTSNYLGFNSVVSASASSTRCIALIESVYIFCGLLGWLFDTRRADLYEKIP